MNPYDFVPLDMNNPPDLRKPVWHSALIGTGNQKLYSGYFSVYTKAETALFIRDADTNTQDPAYPGTHIRNSWDEYIIPGTSIKGMLRDVVETLCGGCMTVFHQPQEYTHNPLPAQFAPCTNNTSLCIACRLFGMMQSKPRRAELQTSDVFLGKVNIGDAYVYEESLYFDDPIYTAVLDTPKPRHEAFYLDQGLIAGRKFYFHHASSPRTQNRLLEIRNKPGTYRNQHIKPLKKGTEFYARIDFTNLETDEFAALLLAITLQPDMRHKIGYGKPIGLGSIQLVPTELKLVDYTARYTSLRTHRGISTYDMYEMADLLKDQMASFDTEVNQQLRLFSTRPSLSHLARIWRWPADSSVVYCYPSQKWFKEHPQTRISGTKDLFPGD